MAITITNVRVTPPTAALATGALTWDVTGAGTCDVQVIQVNPAGPSVFYVQNTTAPLLNLTIAGLVPAIYSISVVDYTAGATPSVLVVVPALPQLLATPPTYAAAHLPCLVAVQASPSYIGGQLTPAPVLLFIDAASGANWVQVASLRQVCDPATNTARFDLSEYLKTQFTPTPPDESGGPDAALAYAYRVRIGIAPGYTGAPTTEAATFSGWAINAAEVINPGAAALPFALAPAAPYAGIPAGYAGFRSLLTTAGVLNAANLPTSPGEWPCPVRQFVWLNPGGGWAYGFFQGRHEYSTEVGDGVLQRDRFGADRYVRRGDVRRAVRVYSDKLTRPVFDVLVGIRDSSQVYERLPTGAYVPVVVEPGSFTDYQDTEKTFTVDFAARYPVLARQTQ